MIEPAHSRRVLDRLDAATRAEVATAFGVSEGTVADWEDQHGFPVRKIGRQSVYLLEEVRAWLRKHDKRRRGRAA